MSQETSKKKAYQKPAWQRETMFERFAAACCLVGGGCNTKTGGNAGNTSS
jgi:hypothetical protein